MAQENRKLIGTAIQIGLIAGAVAVFICLIGMVENLNPRDVVEHVIKLGYFLLIAINVVAGFVASRQTSSLLQTNKPVLNLLAGFIAGLCSGLVLTLFVWLGNTVNVRSVFINASPTLYTILTLGQGMPGLWVLPVIGIVTGLAGAGFHLLPANFRHPINRALLITFFMALFSSLFRVILVNQGGAIAKFAKFLFGQTGLTLSGGAIFFIGTIIYVIVQSTQGAKIQNQFARLPKTGKVSLRILLFAVLIYLVLVLPQVSGPFIAQVIVLVALYILMGLGLNITLGFAGLLDLGFVAFFAIGAYTVGLLTSYGQFGLQHISFWAAIPIAVLVAMLAGAILGLPVLGIRGDYLAIATLGFGEIVRILAGSDWLAPFFGGPQGVLNVQKPCLGLLGPFLQVDVARTCSGIEFGGPKEIYYIAVAGAILIAFVALRLRESRLGRAWLAIREDEDVAEALGINLTQTKLLAYMLGAAFAGLGGAIFATLVGSIFASSMVLTVSLNAVAVIVVGGMGSVPGVIVGATALVGIPELLREVSDYRYLLYGVTLIIMMQAKPEGLWPSATVQRELHHEEPAEASLD